MQEKVIKKIKTSCPFPLQIYNTHIKYNEVRKASGIAFILLNLIQKAPNKEEKFSDVLLKFCIPADLHYIFANEIINLIKTDILSADYNIQAFSDPKYFAEIKIKSIQLTAKGVKMFKEGAIPTGEEKNKSKEIFFNPVYKTFDMTSKQPYMNIADTFLGETFMQKVDVDITGMEDYINANLSKIGLKAEERVVSFSCDAPQNKCTKTDENLIINIFDDKVRFEFEASAENVFFNKYYSSELMTSAMLLKNKYKFAIDGKVMSDIPNIQLEKLGEINNLYIPDDCVKQANRPCKVFVNKANIVEGRKDNTHTVDKELSGRLLSLIDKNAEFATIDSQGLKYYCPYNVSMHCENFNDTFYMHLLIEKIASAEQLKKAISLLLKEYYQKPYQADIAKIVGFCAELLSDENIVNKYADCQLATLSGCDDKISMLIKINQVYSQPLWKEYFDKTARNLFEESVNQIELDNMVYKRTILDPLKKMLNLTDIEYIEKFVQNVQEENENLRYLALESAGFSEQEILGVVNVIPNYMNCVITNQENLAENMLSTKFQNLQFNLWLLNKMCGVNSLNSYSFNSDCDVEEFMKINNTMITNFKHLQQYSLFAPHEYEIFGQYVKLYEPIKEIFSLELAAMKNPDNITKKYILSNIERGKYKDAICELAVRLQYDLRKMFNETKLVTLDELINKARKEKLITNQQADQLHTMRNCRNGLLHPDRKRVNYIKQDIIDWTDIVFSIKEEK